MRASIHPAGGHDRFARPPGRSRSGAGTRLAVALALVACGVAPSRDGAAPSGHPERTSADAWSRAEEAWTRRALDAHALWSALDPASAAGRAAHERLHAADAHYREGIRRLREEEPGAREALEQGIAIAPMDPALYLPLARACRDRGLDLRAADYYGKYLASRPESADAPAARRELAELAPELDGLFDPPAVLDVSPRVDQPVAAAGPERGASAVPLAAGALAGLLLAGVLLWLGRARGGSLAQLAATHPELHPAIAHLVGSLRHELLKHRVGAARDALEALERGAATRAQLDFLHTRLFGGADLRVEWEGHVAALQRALGPRFSLSRDARFRAARRAIHAIAALDGALATQPAPRVVRGLRAAHDALGALDRELARLVASLVRTRVDERLLRRTFDEVRAELHAGEVTLDEARIGAPEEPPELEIFEVDLRLVLKNLLRNAILAVGRAEPPRRVALEADCVMEATGEETVTLAIRDSSLEPLRPEDLRERPFDRGLGLVRVAVERYGGSLDVEPGGEGFAKAVVVRFFRAMDPDEETPRAEARSTTREDDPSRGAGDTGDPLGVIAPTELERRRMDDALGRG